MHFIKPMLAKPAAELPVGETWRYEPKWDGFRTIILIDADGVNIRSRDDKPLNRYFPELIELIKADKPPTGVFDGELLMNTSGVIDFSTLQMRVHPAESRVLKLSREIPASIMLFDAIVIDEANLLDTPSDGRREQLAKYFDVAADPALVIPAPLSLAITPQTDNTAVANTWLAGIPKAGIEGVIAKQSVAPYSPGRRTMLKIKKRHSIDCVIAGYRVHVSGVGIGSLLLGLYDEGELHFVGHTSSFNAARRKEIQQLLEPLRTNESFDVSPGGISRWRKAENDFVAIEPILVCEVAVDKIEHGRIRHAATFVRFRTDKLPEECVFDQL